MLTDSEPALPLPTFIPMAPGHGAFVHVQDEIYDDVFLCVKLSPMLRLLQLSSSSVRELRLNRVASATRAEWQAAFCSFGAVETLDYYQPFEQDLLPESCTVFEAATPDGTDGLFPRLRKVVYSFDRRLMHGGVSQPLWRLAESKKAAGSPLEVNFRDVGDYDAKIEATLGKIAKVTWGEQDTAG
ncbi:hypothetical protein EWM64_g9128 [Hericium alpestre]|uniref:Uncharacterized protein n=1 Tax=Hericium alpestre TaxID=135208 RepID=A0A4Y9ZLP7_9AGAM|nr:hypothetical protein EWM64_g9128 [Hericium alpestre]